MKQIFLPFALMTCLLLTACGSNSVESESIELHAKETPVIETFSASAQSEEVTREENSKATKAQIDWSRAPRFDNFDALVEYLNNCKKNLQTWQPVVCVNGFKPDSNKIPNIRPIWQLSWTDYGNGRILYQITNYPGERVAYAYTHGDTSFLSNEEKNLYNTAVQIVNNAKNFSSDLLYQELYIHDRITEKATYYTENPQPKLARFQTATGALLDGKANCQGYSDAFYMLATMCGISADKVCGDANGSHVWNSVSFNNGSYFVDVTWNDAQCKFDNTAYTYYIYFNAPTNVIGSDHQWYIAHVPKNLLANPDGRNFYHAKAYGNSNGQYFGAWSKTAEDALGHIAYRIANQGYALSWIEAPYNATYANVNNALNYTLNQLTNRGWYGQLYMNVQRRGNYLYFTAKAIPNR